MALGLSGGNLDGVLEAARKASQNSTDQGQRFERLCRAALTAHDGTDGTQRFSRVWHWNESWPHKKPHDNVDTGIDLVAEQVDGTLAAIQCKFYIGQVSTSAVDSFLAASSRPEFAARIIMTTGSGFQPHGRNKLNHAHPACEVFDKPRMSGWSIDWWEVAEQTHAVAAGTPRRARHTARTRVGWLISESRRQVVRYARSVRSRFNDAARHESPWKRLLWRGLVVLEAVVVAVLLAAAVGAAAFVALSVALMVLVLVAVAEGGGNKRRRRRRLW